MNFSYHIPFVSCGVWATVTVESRKTKSLLTLCGNDLALETPSKNRKDKDNLGCYVNWGNKYLGNFLNHTHP